MKSSLDHDYLEVGTVARLREQLEGLDRERDYKISKALAYSLFILNVIKQRHGQKDPASLAVRLNRSLNNYQISLFFDGFAKLDNDPVHYIDLVNWVRNRMVHFNEHVPRGMTVEGRVAGIRGFRLEGKLTARSQRMFSGTSNRRMLTVFVGKIVDIYMECLEQEGVVIPSPSINQTIEDVDRSA